MKGSPHPMVAASRSKVQQPFSQKIAIFPREMQNFPWFLKETLYQHIQPVVENKPSTPSFFSDRMTSWTGFAKKEVAVLCLIWQQNLIREAKCH